MVAIRIGIAFSIQSFVRCPDFGELANWEMQTSLGSFNIGYLEMARVRICPLSSVTIYIKLRTKATLLSSSTPPPQNVSNNIILPSMTMNFHSPTITFCVHSSFSSIFPFIILLALSWEIEWKRLSLCRLSACKRFTLQPHQMNRTHTHTLHGVYTPYSGIRHKFSGGCFWSICIV